jgi:hypothetical protein
LIYINDCEVFEVDPASARRGLRSFMPSLIVSRPIVLSRDIARKPPRLNLLWALGKRLKEHPLARVGPGLITGVADDDPSGIATYSQAGAQFGLNMLWTMPLAFPLMAAVQSMCARIGRVSGKGLAANIKETFHPVVLYGVVTLLLAANIFNIAADIAVMGEVAELVTGFHRQLMTIVFVLATLLLQVFVPYHRYVSFLKWLTLSLLAYAAVLFTVHVPLGPGGAAHFLASSDAEFTGGHGGGRSLRHHHQPLPLLLAGLRGSGGYAEP